MHSPAHLLLLSTFPIRTQTSTRGPPPSLHSALVQSMPLPPSPSPRAPFKTALVQCFRAYRRQELRGPESPTTTLLHRSHTRFRETNLRLISLFYSHSPAQISGFNKHGKALRLPGAERGNVKGQKSALNTIV